jgi:outer membrane receptor protein involved in Fe transport
LTPPLDVSGVNTSTGTPKWRWNASLTYSLNPFTATLAARGVSAGKYANNLIECSSGCPVGRQPPETLNYPTINDNHLAGEIFFDLSVGYTVPMGKDDNSELNLFLNVRNLTNRDPVIAAGGPSGLPFDTVTTNPADYDSLGRVFTAGFRFKL